VPFCVRWPYARLAAAACLLASALAIASCAELKIPSFQQGPQATPPGTPQTVPPSAPPVAVTPQAEELPPVAPPVTSVPGKVNVALLLPLSGPSGALGKAMLNAAQMALFDLANDRLELLTRDTQGTPAGAAAAAQSVIASGAQLILGPLLAGEVEAVRPLARAAHVPVIAFSTAAQLAGDGIYLMGFTPGEEIARVTAYAHAHGHERFAVLAPRSPYGQVVADAVRAAVAANGATLVRVELYDPALGDVAATVRSFAAQGLDYDALFLPEGDGRLKTLAPQLPYFDIDPDEVKFLGTGLWDEPGLGTEPSLDGGWYAAPPPALRAAFEQRYREFYKTSPPRLATLGYDATALAAVLSRGSQGADFSDATLTNPNGFSGVDGIFRLRPDGLVQRGLAVLEVHRGAGTVIDPAPKSFQAIGY
jgi:ABC-type branched-subunit amino acid transport system substrate-binding protein